MASSLVAGWQRYGTKLVARRAMSQLVGGGRDTRLSPVVGNVVLGILEHSASAAITHP